MSELNREPVSVVIPTYNRESMVGDAIESALSQCRGQDEILVVDDGSSDSTAEVVGRFDKPVRYIFQNNAGAGAARNNGIRQAGHDLIAFLDSDDLWQPGKLEKQVPLMMARRDMVMSFADFCVRHIDGRESEWYLSHWHGDSRTWDEILGPGERLSELTGTGQAEKDDPLVHVGDLYNAEMTASYVFTSTVVARRSAATRGLYFSDKIAMYEDWACFGRLAGAGPVAYIKDQLAVQRGHAEGRLTDADVHARARARVHVLEEVWGEDQEFLNNNFRSYRQLLDGQKIIVASGLISEGRNGAARELLREVKQAPMTYRVLASLPAPVSSLILSLRRWLLRLAGR